MDAFGAGKIDANSHTNGDHLILAAGGKKGVAILVNDYSAGNDQIVAKPGIKTLADLKGKKVGVEVNIVDHLLLDYGLEKAGLSINDVTLVNMPTNDTPQALGSGGVDAVGCWQPIAGQAAASVPGAKAIYTSADAPGLIYDCLFVSAESYAARKDDWQKVVGVWYKTWDYIHDPATRAEAIAIMAARVKVDPATYAKFVDGTHLLSYDEETKVLTPGPGLDSVYGSTENWQKFLLKNGVYKDAQDVKPIFTDALVKGVKK
jgi:NitT/TauT family transport system substrate-binding protein